MYSDHKRNLTQDARDDLAISTSQGVAIYASGWCAAQAGEPRDETGGAVWLMAFDLWHERHPRADYLQ